MSKHFCSHHLPKSNLYLRDRTRLKTLEAGRFGKQVGHLNKLKLLSEVLDEQAASPQTVFSNTRMYVRNGNLMFDHAFESIRNNFSYAGDALSVESFSLDYVARWFDGFLHRIGSISIETLKQKNMLTHENYFEAIFFMSARFHAYKKLDDIFTDRRQREFRNLDASKEDQEILLAIQKAVRKPNGRINRKNLASECGMSRYKIQRIIERLKSNGKINSGM